MNIPEVLVPLTALFLIFGGGTAVTRIIQNMNATRVELARLRAEHNSGQRSDGNLGRELAAVREDVAALRQQLNELRDTATQYDLSFDTALQRMESRVANVERRTLPQTTADAPQNVTLGGR